MAPRFIGTLGARPVVVVAGLFLCPVAELMSLSRCVSHRGVGASAAPHVAAASPPPQDTAAGGGTPAPHTTADEIVTLAFLALQRPAEDDAIFLAVFPHLGACLDRLRHGDVSRLLPPRPSVPAPLPAPSTVLPGEAQRPAVPMDDTCPRDGSQHGTVVPAPPLLRKMLSAPPPTRPTKRPSS